MSFRFCYPLLNQVLYVFYRAPRPPVRVAYSGGAARLDRMSTSHPKLPSLQFPQRFDQGGVQRVLKHPVRLPVGDCTRTVLRNNDIFLRIDTDALAKDSERPENAVFAEPP